MYVYLSASYLLVYIPSIAPINSILFVIIIFYNISDNEYFLNCALDIFQLNPFIEVYSIVMK